MRLRHKLQPSDHIKPTSKTLESAFIAPVTYLKAHLELGTKYALPFAGATLSGPLLALLPLGPVGPVLAILAASFSRFKLRQNAAGSYYVLLHSAGLAGVSGQVLSLMSFMSLGAVFGSTGAAAQSYVTSLILSTGDFKAPVIGLVLSLLTSWTGWFGVLPGFVGGSGANILFNELRSFALFRGLGWGLRSLERGWRQCFKMVWHKWVKGEDRNGDYENNNDRGDWGWRLMRSTIEKIGWRWFGNRQSICSKEALDEWEMLSQSSDEEHDAKADPAVSGAFPVSATNNSVRPWLEDVDWDNSTICELDDDGLMA